jgi:hypothetical protein
LGGAKKLVSSRAPFSFVQGVRPQLLPFDIPLSKPPSERACEGGASPPLDCVKIQLRALANSLREFFLLCVSKVLSLYRMMLKLVQAFQAFVPRIAIRGEFKLSSSFFIDLYIAKPRSCA